MGALTDDATRLCQDILAMRQARRTLNMALLHGNADRKNVVSEMCAGFAQARAEMARQAKAVRNGFLNNLTQRVNGHRRETQADLMGARRAWMGKCA